MILQNQRTKPERKSLAAPTAADEVDHAEAEVVDVGAVVQEAVDVAEVAEGVSKRACRFEITSLLIEQ